MTPTKPGDDVRLSVRTVLHECGAEVRTPPATDDLLRDVHRGAARRRRRRSVTAAGLVAVAVTGAGVAVLQRPPPATTVADPPAAYTVPSAGPAPARAPATATAAAKLRARRGFRLPSAPAPSSASDQRTAAPAPGDRISATALDVRSVTAVQGDQFWLLGTGRCGAGQCPVIAHTSNAGHSFVFRTGPVPTPQPAPDNGGSTTLGEADRRTAEVTTSSLDLRYAVNGDDAWEYAGQLWATHDAGRSWTPVSLPVAASITDVQPWAGTVWAFGTSVRDGRPLVFSAPVGTEDWRVAELGLEPTDSLSVPVVTDGVVAAVVTRADGTRDLVRTLDGGLRWELVPLGFSCDSALSSNGIAGALWLYCRSPDGADVAVSHDAGTTWAAQPVLEPETPLTVMSGIDPLHALITDGSEVEIATISGDAAPVEGPYTAEDDVWGGEVGYTYAGFTDPLTGYLITSGGMLARSEDGGLTWAPVDLP